MKVKRSALEIKIELLEQQVNILQARIVQLEAGLAARPIPQPYRPQVGGDGSTPWRNPFPNIWYGTINESGGALTDGSLPALQS